LLLTTQHPSRRGKELRLDSAYKTATACLTDCTQPVRIAVAYLIACYKIIVWLECGMADGLVANTQGGVH
jgi:hypothetical protein